MRNEVKFLSAFLPSKLFITARKRSLGQGCVKNSVHRGGRVCSGGVPAPVGLPGPRGGCLLPGGAWSHGGARSRGVCLPGGVPGGDPPWDGYFSGWYTSYWNAFLYYSHDHKSFIIRGGSRIPRRRGRQPTGGGVVPTYDFAKFSKKLHEIMTILGRRGRRAPPLDPPLITSVCVRGVRAVQCICPSGR